MTLVNELLTKVWLGLKGLKDERGQDLLEYALLGGLIAVAVIVGIGIFAGELNTWFEGMGNFVSDNLPPALGG